MPDPFLNSLTRPPLLAELATFGVPCGDAAGRKVGVPFGVAFGVVFGVAPAFAASCCRAFCFWFLLSFSAFAYTRTPLIAWKYRN